MEGQGDVLEDNRRRRKRNRLIWFDYLSCGDKKQASTHKVMLRQNGQIGKILSLVCLTPLSCNFMIISWVMFRQRFYLCFTLDYIPPLAFFIPPPQGSLNFHEIRSLPRTHPHKLCETVLWVMSTEGHQIFVVLINAEGEKKTRGS